MITDIAEVTAAHQLRHEAARRGIRKTAARRSYVREHRGPTAIRL